MKLLLVDPHPLFGVGFVHALTQARPGMRVRASLTVEEGLAVAASMEPDVVVLDHRLGCTRGDDGLAGLRRFGDGVASVPRVLIADGEDPWLSERARAAGAAGFLTKSQPVGPLLRALDRVAAGGQHFDAAPLRAIPQLSQATPRQLEVLALVSRGLLNKQIADQLGIAERTVKVHVTALLDAFAAQNRTHLLVRARELGLVA